MKQAIVTGAKGFVGSYLTEHLKEKGLKVFEGGRENCDVTQPEQIKQVIEENQPDCVFHLAAIASIKQSNANPVETYRVNLFGAKNLLEAVKEHAPESKVVLVGSSEQYGFVREEEIPIKESQEFRPMSDYAVSKLAADLLGYQYFKNHGLKVVRMRPFNHTGPKRKASFVLSSWCKQVAEMEKGKKEKVLPVGNIETVRDFTDVRDVAKAYHLAAEKGVEGEAYNVCSSQGLPLKELIEKVKEVSGQEFKVERSTGLTRRVDVPRLIGDNSKLAQATGWKQEIPLEKTIEDMLDFWRERVAGE